MKFSIERYGSTIILDTETIADLPEITQEEFIAKTDLNLKDGSLLDNHVLIGIGREIKEYDMKRIVENRGAFKFNDMYLVYWSENVEDEKKAIHLCDKEWMIIFCEEGNSNIEVPKYIYNKAAYLK